MTLDGLYSRNDSYGEKIKPTKGSFKKDLLRALHQLYDAQKYGWHLEDDGTYSAETTDADIAPEAIIELISCHCGGNCNDRPCGCVKNDTCENADPSPPDNTN